MQDLKFQSIIKQQKLFRRNQTCLLGSYLSEAELGNESYHNSNPTTMIDHSHFKEKIDGNHPEILNKYFLHLSHLPLSSKRYDSSSAKLRIFTGQILELWAVIFPLTGWFDAVINRHRLAKGFAICAIHRIFLGKKMVRIDDDVVEEDEN